MDTKRGAALEEDMEPPYDRLFQGILAFSDFVAAETCIRRLENLRNSFQDASDMKGVGGCREIALRGRRRAEFIARNPRVSMQKRLEKREIAAWFGLWMETPEIFENWLELRKRTPEFQKLLKAAAGCRPGSESSRRRTGE